MSAQQPTVNGATSDADEEARIKDAMKRLKLLHIKARMLRDTIPRMLDPLVQKQASPEMMYAVFMKTVNDAQISIKEFTELMRDDVSKEVFAMADKSREENPFGIKSWKHKDHPNWFNMEKDDED